ncbi:HutD family protein [Amylibacter sp. IMCC11727]|uniref:HutD/Ves family protein n=1 Tax=Amylibacter sp. IMCC11727 TaxID=3039851 RepID=UPI00244E23E5|nr:HutD family protein [Amylibacter sp. IMCC11727]WGI22664.1 HutD family protein [Amylibacter sp. IMCC11727]
MKTMPRDMFKTMPWPNGQGVAHEVFHQVEDGRTVLRISLAEVVGDCLFSAFDGLQRSTTVVSGAGMDLTHSDGVIELRPFEPVTWDGGLALTGALVDGAVENFNVIWDAARTAVEVRVCEVSEARAGDVVFVLSGEVAGVGRHGVVWVDGEVNSAACVICVRSTKR